jgi:hypothetical protein
VDDEFWQAHIPAEVVRQQDGYALSGHHRHAAQGGHASDRSKLQPGPNKSIDHATQIAKLDNRINLRIATDHEQMRNKAPRPGGSSMSACMAVKRRLFP